MLVKECASHDMQYTSVSLEYLRVFLYDFKNADKTKNGFVTLQEKIPNSCTEYRFEMYELHSGDVFSFVVA